MDPYTGRRRALFVEGDEVFGVPEGRSHSSDDLELIVAESCEAAFRQGWAEGYAAGSRYARPVLGAPRRELEMWLARGLLVVLVLAGMIALANGLLEGS